MNMKKTIAAIAAGSVAVSAMATTVSALDAKTLTYSLVQNIRKNDATGTITYTFNNIPVTAGQTVEVVAIGAGPWDCVITVSGSYADINQSILPTTFTKRSWTDAYDKIPADMIQGYDKNGDDVTDSMVEIPVVATTGVSGSAKATNLVAGLIKNLTVTVDYYNLPASVNYTGALNTEINLGNRGILVATRTGSYQSGDWENDASAVVQAQGFKPEEVIVDPDAPAGVYTYTAGGDADYDYTAATGSSGAATGAYTGTESGTYTYTASGWTKDGMTAVIGFPGLTITSPQAASPASQDAATGTFTAVTTNAANNTKKNAATVTLTYDKGDAAGGTVTAGAGWVVGSPAAASELVDPADWGITITTDPVAADNGKTIIVGAYTAAKDADTITVTAAEDAGWSDGTNLVTLADKGVTFEAGAGAPIAGDKITVTAKASGTWGGATIAYQSELAGKATSVSGNTAKEIPYRSSLKNSAQYNYWFEGIDTEGARHVDSNNAVGGGDVFTRIGYAAADNSYIVGDGEVDDWTYTDQSAYGINARRYTNDAALIAQNVRAVVNDAIQNYSDVTFVFNTATKNVKVWTDENGYVTDYEYTGDGASDRSKDGNHSGDWKQVINYTAFGRHYWDRDTGYDANTIYISNDWLGNNLFEGALIINNNLTLSLGATDKFDWTSTSLSFSWDAIQDAALTTNQYANYIQNMVLRTSSDWYWDNMQVVLGATEDEDVGTTSPVEAEEEELETEEPEVDVEPVEEPEVPAEPEPEPEPVAAPNPGTGNAPVALAVIPVALAAAAIVAKKRG